jgi:hypothetical protein
VIRPRVLLALTVAATWLAAAASAHAQAWVPAKGEGSVSFLVQDLLVKDHLTASGARQDRGRIDSNNLVVDVSYGVTDRLAVTLALPYIRTRYTGLARHPSDQDDGAAHAGVQDVRFGVRYNLYDGAVTITPFVGTSVPSHSYQYFAHAAYGPRLRELQLGTYIGRVIPAGPRPAFVQARYAYGFLQEIAGVDRGRSSLDVEVGYFVSRSVRVFATSAGQKSHGGIDLPDAGYRALPIEQQEHHDRISRIDILDVGGGVQMTLSKSWEIFGSLVKTVSGENAHALARGLTIGASWSFGTGVPALVAAVAPGKSPEKLMARCLCQKK